MIVNHGKTNRASFDIVAPYYDELMSHVNYPGWVRETMHIASCLDREPVRILDMACGTGTFASTLARESGWTVVGLDSSVEMVRCGAEKVRPEDSVHLVVAEMQRPALRAGFDVVVSLFDSINFVLTDADLRCTFQEVYSMLLPDGLFFFDVITERNVLRNFEGERWEESVAKTTCKWSSAYDTERRLVYTTLDMRKVAVISVVERIYSDAEIRNALTDTGFGIVAVTEAHTWNEPAETSERVEYVACKGDTGPPRHKFPAIRNRYMDTLPIR